MRLEVFSLANDVYTFRENLILTLNILRSVCKETPLLLFWKNVQTFSG